MADENRDWYVGINGESFGPITWTYLIEQARVGALEPSALVWCVGLPHWVEASSVPGLFVPPTLPLARPASKPALMIVPGVSTNSIPQQKQAMHPTAEKADDQPSDPPKKPAWYVEAFLAPKSEVDAAERVKMGVYAGLVLSGMYVLGGLLFFNGKSPGGGPIQSSDDPFWSGISSLLIAAIVAALSFWFKRKPGPAIPALLLLLFVVELLTKAQTQAFNFNFGWLIFYFCIFASFFAGIRGGWFFRNHRKKSNASLNVLNDHPKPT